MVYIIRDKDGNEVFLTYSENQAYEYVNFDNGETLEERSEIDFQND